MSLSYSSGYNDYGQLGTGDNQHKDKFTLIQLPAEIKSIESVHAGLYHAVILGHNQDNQSIIATCGNNEYGQLGTTNNQLKNEWTFIQLPADLTSIDFVRAGAYHTVIVGRNRGNQPLVLACGRNNFGQLGSGDDQNKSQFTCIPLPEGMTSIHSVETGERHTIVAGYNIAGQLMVAVCGDNSCGQLGTGDYHSKKLLTLIKLPQDMTSIVSVSAGKSHTIILGHNQDQQPIVATCGDNDCGQLGTGDKKTKNQLISIQVPETMTTIESAHAGSDCTFIVGHNKEKQPMVVACGANVYGQLGIGVLGNKKQLTTIQLPTGMARIQSLMTGSGHTIVVGFNKDNQPIVAACGSNYLSQLGITDYQNRYQLTLLSKPKFFYNNPGSKDLEMNTLPTQPSA